jgi:hypothetical protein
MERTFSEMQDTTELSRRRLSLRSVLRIVGLSSLLVCLLLLFSTVSPSTPAFHQSRVVHTVTRQPSVASVHLDLVIVVDNIGEIQSHDPRGARFRGAQMLVDQAPAGDRIGIVRIPSLDNPSPVKLLDLTTIHNENERNTVKHMLTQRFFGPVDPGPTAYFVPAFQTASQMLLSAQDTNPKSIIVMTDSLAQSGDQERCPAASDPYHQWFCEIPQLQAHNISLMLFGFTTTPGNEAEFQPIRQFLQKHGASAFQVG